MRPRFLYKNERKESWWFHYLRYMTWFNYRYWWVLLGLFIATLIWYFCFCNCSEVVRCENIRDYNLEDCCACKTKIDTVKKDTLNVKAIDCPNREFVFEVCNSNRAVDDNFDVYLNEQKIGTLNLNKDEYIGAVFIASTNTNLKLKNKVSQCELIDITYNYFPPGLLNKGKNIIKLVNVKNNRNHNRGSILLKNYFRNGDILENPCSIKELSYEMRSGDDKIIEFIYDKCCANE